MQIAPFFALLTLSLAHTTPSSHKKCGALEAEVAALKKEHAAFKKAVDTRFAALETLASQLRTNLTSVTTKVNNKNPTFDSVTIGRWRVMPESDIALVFRDMVSTNKTNDARYAMWNGKYVDIDEC